MFPRSPWDFTFTVKRPPPFNVQVTNTDGFYNITWDNNDQEDCFTYNVRIRSSIDLSKVKTQKQKLKIGLEMLLEYIIVFTC